MAETKKISSSKQNNFTKLIYRLRELMLSQINLSYRGGYLDQAQRAKGSSKERIFENKAR
jgi:hypothetical protein